MATGNARLEREIVIGLVVSDIYIAGISKVLQPEYFVVSVAKTVAVWCLEYFEKYGTAPGSKIETILEDQSDNGLDEDLKQDILDLLPTFKLAYKRRTKFNAPYLRDRTIDYCKSRRIELHTEHVQSLLQSGRTEEAEKLQSRFSPLPSEERRYVDVGSEESIERLSTAFNRDLQRVVQYPGALGHMFNDQFVRGGFVAFLAPEKRGKTFFLMDATIRALTQRANVVFFQVGDTMEVPMLKRIAIRLAKRPDRGSQDIIYPVKDCVLNQIGRCTKPEREGDRDLNIESSSDLTYDLLMERLNSKKYDNYAPCKNCDLVSKYGSFYLAKTHREYLTKDTAAAALTRFRKRHKHTFRLATYYSGEVTAEDLFGILDEYENTDGFVPDMIVIDYADLLVGGGRDDYRHRVNETWKTLRALSQERHCLVLTATQADANAHKQARLHLTNFSEDKRKYAHVTAMYGLNQNSNSREKDLGILRVNQLVVREGHFSSFNEVHVLQSLPLGRPAMDSFIKNVDG